MIKLIKKILNKNVETQLIYNYNELLKLEENINIDHKEFQVLTNKELQIPESEFYKNQKPEYVQNDYKHNNYQNEYWDDPEEENYDYNGFHEDDEDEMIFYGPDFDDYYDLDKYYDVENPYDIYYSYYNSF